MSKTIRYVVLGLCAVILLLSAVYFMNAQSNYVRQRDVKMEALRMAQDKATYSQQAQPSQPKPSTSEPDTSSSVQVDSAAQVSLVRAKAAADAVLSMQEKYPALMARIGVSEFKQDEEAINEIIKLREEGLKPYFPNDSWFREVWFTENDTVGPVKWNTYVASQLNSDRVPVVWVLTDSGEHVLVCVSAYYDEATNSFQYPVCHWTAYGSNAVAFTGNDDIESDDREVDEFVKSVQDLIGLPSSNSNGSEEGGSD